MSCSFWCVVSMTYGSNAVCPNGTRQRIDDDLWPGGEMVTASSLLTPALPTSQTGQRASFISVRRSDASTHERGITHPRPAEVTPWGS